jgi:hypothetical protein
MRKTARHKPGSVNTPARLLRVVISSLFIASAAWPLGCAVNRPLPPVSPPAGTAWALEFDVDFNGNDLDNTKLTPCFDWNAGHCTSSFNQGREHYLPSQVQLRDGLAHLVAQPLTPPYPDSACYGGLCTYKSGLLSTARPDQSSPYLYSFTYGYVESRLKLPSKPGMFTAFWMLPAHPNFQYDYEIDILENLAGKPEVIYQTYVYDNRRTGYKVNDVVQETNGKCAKTDYSSGFHTYGVDWERDHIAFYIDGTECGRFTPNSADQIASEPMQIILSLMVDINWQRAAKLVLDSQSVIDELAVDYLRVWQAH